jgi:UDP-2,3-diacylglucosamine hydrolase
MRTESEGLKRTDRVDADVDTTAALAWLQAADAPTLVHGHTHKPADHALDAAHRRVVLSDWDADASPPRLEALRMGVDGDVQRMRLA